MVSQKKFENILGCYVFGYLMVSHVSCPIISSQAVSKQLKLSRTARSRNSSQAVSKQLKSSHTALVLF